MNGQAVRLVFAHDITTARPANSFGGRAVSTFPLRVLRQTLLSLAITAGLIGLLLRWTGTDLAGIGRALASVDPFWYWVALGVQLCIYPLRAARFACLLNHEVWQSAQRRAGTGALVPVTMAHSFLAYVLPGKIGEASLLWYLRQGWGVSASRGAAVLIVSRLLDLVCVSSFLCVACLAVGYGESAQNAAHMLTLGWILVPTTLLLAWGLFRGPAMVGVLRAMLKPLFQRTGSVGARVQKMLLRLQEALVEVPLRSLGFAALWSPFIWVGVFLFYALLARGFGLDDLSLAQATFGAGLAVLFSLLPVSAFAGFGSQDAGWVLGFTAVGVERVLATESGLAIHLIYAAHIVILGLVGHAWARRLRAGWSERSAADSES